MITAPRSEQCINLTFHGIGEPTRTLAPGEKDVWIALSRFLSILDDVKDRTDIRLSFDDGNVSDVVYGLPALQERGLRAAFFIVAGRLGTPDFLSDEDVRLLTNAGMTIGCHGMTHAPWRGLSRHELHEELGESRRILEEVTGNSVTTAACPFGAYDRRTLKALHKYRYRRVFTSDDGLARSDRWLQPRNSITQRTGEYAVDYVLARNKPLCRAAVRHAKLAVKRWR